MKKYMINHVMNHAINPVLVKKYNIYGCSSRLWQISHIPY